MSTGYACAGTFGAVTESGAVASNCKAEVVYGVFPDNDASTLTVACLRKALLNTQSSRLSDTTGVFVGELGLLSGNGHQVGKWRVANALRGDSKRLLGEVVDYVCSARGFMSKGRSSSPE